VDPGAHAPVVIYRAALDDEEGDWLVTTLMDRDAFGHYSRGLADDTVVQGVAAAVVQGTISASDHNPSRRK
jgi:hypothetical protein